MLYFPVYTKSLPEMIHYEDRFPPNSLVNVFPSGILLLDIQYTACVCVLGSQAIAKDVINLSDLLIFR